MADMPETIEITLNRAEIELIFAHINYWIAFDNDDDPADYALLTKLDLFLRRSARLQSFTGAMGHCQHGVDAMDSCAQCLFDEMAQD